MGLACFFLSLSLFSSPCAKTSMFIDLKSLVQLVHVHSFIHSFIGQPTLDKSFSGSGRSGIFLKRGERNER